MMNAAHLKECVEYSAETGIFTFKTRPHHHFNSEGSCKAWNARFAGKETGSKDSRGHIQVKIDGNKTLAHRLAFIYMTGACPEIIDHINTNKTDNRWANLRAATKQQNCANRKSAAGVYKTKSGRYRAQICVGYKIKCLGTFDTEEEAIESRRAAHISAFREFSPYSQQGAFRADNFEDMAAYAGLAGESAIRARELES